jgi:TonB family protein
MMHGVQGFFAERARATRRVAALALGLAMVLLAWLLALTLPAFRRPLREMARHTTRFGFEGEDQFVRRITLQQLQGTSPVLHDVGAIDARRARAGGATRAPRAEHPRARPETRTDAFGPGQSDRDMTARAVSRLANVPVVQSEDLVIEHASMPIYPEAESERGIEGKVMVQALVDTAGRVVDVQLLASSGVGAFERSAADAVWQYRFRPYRPSGVASEVYAIFRFSFRIY